MISHLLDKLIIVSFRLHTGSYLVERTGEGESIKFDFEIAMSVMTITKIEFGTLPVSILETYPILMYFCKMFANIFYLARFLLLTLLVAAGSNPS